MSDVKWIKITTDIFDDEKIKLIEALPDAYAIITCWFKLLCMAGKQNNGGVFLMCGRIAYTDQMLATIFRMKEATVKMALGVFQNFGMVEILDGVITIPNWSKHQSQDALETRREKDRLRKADARAKQKALAEGCPQDVRGLSADASPSISPSESSSKEDEEGCGEKKIRHKHGRYKNVLFTDEDFEKLQDEFPDDWGKRIERLSEYMASTGKSYKNHLATIRSWARKDHGQKPAKPESGNIFYEMGKKEGVF